jgi:hypothetical protein
VRISAQVEFGIVRLTKRNVIQKLGASKFDNAKRCSRALHKTSPGSFLIAGWQMIGAMMPRSMSEPPHLKMDCERCGEHIEYPSEMAGQSIQCPACQHTIMLLSPPPPPQPPKTMKRASGGIRGVRLYWIKKQGDSEATGPFSFPQVQGMWRAGTVKGHGYNQARRQKQVAFCRRTAARSR